MIVTELHDGQGLGNQLWCYVSTRIIALKNGYDFGIASAQKFKGVDMMNLDFGKQITDINNHYTESALYHLPSFSDIRTCDKNLVHIGDNAQIDGLMQDVSYIIEYKDTIRTWLQIDPKFDCRDYSDDNICVINFRGGGYARDIKFFLPTKYWKNCIAAMRKINPKFRFIVISDDPVIAKMFFPDFEVFHWSIGKDYAVIKNAKYLILSNSSFAWFPAWLSQDLKYCIAPKYWARHNISDGYWSLGYNITPGWQYMDRKGVLSDYDTCQKELTDYISDNATKFSATLPHKHLFLTHSADIIHIFMTLKKDFSTLYIIRKMSILYSIKAMLTLRDGIKSLLGISSYTQLSHTPHIQDKINGVISRTQNQDFKERLRMFLKRIIVTQGYY